MSEAYPEKDNSELNDLWVQYQVKRVGNNANIEMHIQHLINLYALTGYGQSYINKAKSQLERKYAKFLMVNNRAEGSIKIRSTKAIVKDEILGNGISGFGGHWSTKNSNKYKAYYKI